jgi:hypothetical protein
MYRNTEKYLQSSITLELHSSTLKKKAIYSSVTSMNIHYITRGHILEFDLHAYRRDNLKSQQYEQMAPIEPQALRL